MSKVLIEDAVAILPIQDMNASLAFYEDVLGFERGFVADDLSFATIKHGEAALHLLQTDDEASLEASKYHISVYLWVKGVDRLYQSLADKLSSLAEGRVRAPFDQPYGMREFHVKDEDGCLLFFGENLLTNGNS